MRLTEFVINLFTRFAPVNEQTLNDLKVELGHQYAKMVHKSKLKMDKNKPLEEQLDGLEAKMSQHDEHTPEYQELNRKYFDLKANLEKETFFEKVVSFFEKPMVRAALLILFVIASRWIAKRMMAKDEDKQDFEAEPETGNHNQNNWSPYYGHGVPYGYPPPPPPQQYQNYQPQNYNNNNRR